MIIRQPIERPPKVARGFVRALNDYFAEKDPIRRGAIAAHQLDVLRQYHGPREKQLRLNDIRKMFEQMRQSEV